MLDGILIVLPIVVCMITGYFLKRVGMISAEGATQIGKIVFYLASPSVLFRMTLKVRPENFADTNYIFAYHAALFASLVVSFVIGSLRGCNAKRKAASCMMSLRSNCVFMGIPTIIMLWGEEMMPVYGLFMALSITGMEIFAALFSLVVLHGGLKRSSVECAFKSFLRNPVVMSCIVGAAFGLFIGVDLPRCIDLPLKIFADLGTGLALLTLGMKIEPERVLSDMLSTWPDILMRLIITPVIMWSIFKLMGSTPDLAKVAILVMAMPVATNSLPMAEAMGMDGDYTARATMATTVMSVFSLPLIAAVLLR